MMIYNELVLKIYLQLLQNFGRNVDNTVMSEKWELHLLNQAKRLAVQILDADYDDDSEL